MEIEIEDKEKIGDYDALLAKLWKQPEGSRVDYKAVFVFGKDAKKEMYGLVKDILAMGNTEGGGYLIIGQKNTGEADDCSPEVVQSFDTSKLHAQTRKYGRPEPKYIVSKATSPEGTTAILICVEEFEDHLIICQENGDDDENKAILRAGAIY
jgi:hypothetical protein